MSRRWSITLTLAALLGAPAALQLPAQDTRAQPSGWMGVLLGGGRGGADAEAAAPARPGVTLSGIVRGGPADEAGLRARDRLIAIDGEPVGSPRQLIERIRALEPGRWLHVTAERGKDVLEFRLELDVRPDNPGDVRMREAWIGIRAIDLPPSLREHFGAPEDAGVMVSSIDAGSPAEAAGFRLGDVVYELDGAPVREPRQLARWIAGGGVGNTLEFTLARDGVEIVLEATLDDAPEDLRSPGNQRRRSERRIERDPGR